MNKTQFYTLSGALLASTALCGSVGAGVLAVGHGRSATNLLDTETAARLSTAALEVDAEPGLFASAAAVVRENTNALVLGAVLALPFALGLLAAAA